MTDFGELAEVDVAVYRAALKAPACTSARLAELTGLTPDDVDKCLAQLVAFGLVRTGLDDTLTAVSPMLAEATVLGADDLELSARRAAVEHKRNAIRQLVPDWNEAFESVIHEVSVDAFSDQAEISNILMHYANSCRSELMSVAPGRAPSTRLDGRTRLANVYTARRGIVTRAVYQHSSLRDRASRAYVMELAENGARIRFTPTVPGRCLVIDRSIALLPTPTEDPGRLGLAVVREPNVVSWVIATFEQMWAESAPLEDVIHKQQHDETELDETRAAILRLMAEGEKDEAISRRLSISVRTCRRHIADYMAQVGAGSRFQAGVIAARAGHTDLPNSR